MFMISCLCRFCILETICNYLLLKPGSQGCADWQGRLCTTQHQLKLVRRKSLFCPVSAEVLWLRGEIEGMWPLSYLLLQWERDRMSCSRSTPRSDSAVPNILGQISVLTVCSPCHPCSNALGISHHPLCTLYGCSDVILQQSTAIDPTGIHSSWGFAIITPVSAIDLKYPIVSALVSTVVVCSSCVIIALVLS